MHVAPQNCPIRLKDVSNRLSLSLSLSHTHTHTYINIYVCNKSFQFWKTVIFLNKEDKWKIPKLYFLMPFPFLYFSKDIITLCAECPASPSLKYLSILRWPICTFIQWPQVFLFIVRISSMTEEHTLQIETAVYKTVYVPFSTKRHKNNSLFLPAHERNGQLAVTWPLRSGCRIQT